MRILALPFAVAGIALLAAGQAWADEEPQAVKVRLEEWDLGFKKVEVEGEKARFDIANDGTAAHAFELEGEIGGQEFEVATPLLEPGETASLIVELPAGEYEVYCPVDGHADRGMEGTVTFGGE